MVADTPITIVNGADSRHVSVLDRGLAYGDGAFETMLLKDGDIRLWKLHYERFQRSLSALAIPLELSALAMQMRRVFYAIEKAALEQAVIKLIVTRGEGGRGYQSPTQVNPNLIAIISHFSPNPSMDKGIKVHYCHQQLSPQPLSGIKTLNQLAYVLASDERSGSDCMEGLLFNHQDQLIEATARNVFLVDDNRRLLTPRLDQCGIEGVMRRLIIETIAPQLGIEVKQMIVTRADIVNAKELFLTNSVTHIWPVTRCEDKILQQGPLTVVIKNNLLRFLNNEDHLSYSQHAEMHIGLNSD